MKTKKERKQKKNSWKYFGKFLPYYKPYAGLLIFDMLCAMIATACDLILPVYAQKITNSAIAEGHVVLSIVLVFAITLFIEKNHQRNLQVFYQQVRTYHGRENRERSSA